jgi:4-hydroxy-3-polyprenylbenzoate decarboxylase
VSGRVVVAITGASGAALGARIVELLAQQTQVAVDLVVSPAGERTLAEEVGSDALARIARMARQHHAVADIGAAIASGSVATAGMIVAPCSMRTLAAIAHGLADNLIVRAADVHLKERRPLVLLVRETPLHLGHLRNMVLAAELGAVVMPPVPAFYLQPRSVVELIDQVARRAIDALKLGPPLGASWEGEGGTR